MQYQGTIYRPPLEANTPLLPVTQGCSHNKCTFCNMYQGVPFRVLPNEQIEAYLRHIAQIYARVQNLDRIYLVGADPFALSATRLTKIAELIKNYLPNIKTITMYARVDNIASKSDEALKMLKVADINDLYVGVESGDDDALKALNKGYDAQQIKTQCLRLNEAGIAHNDLLMLGTGGAKRGEEVAKATAKLQNQIRPGKILLNTMSAFEDTKLNEDIKAGRFIPASERENLEEEVVLLENLELPNTYFWAAHPLDAVAIAGDLTQKEEMIRTLKHAANTINSGSYRQTSRRGTL